jgi:pyrimidine-nucleoside phosphorylase
MRSFYDIIADKRDGKKLSREDIEFFLKSYLDGSLKDYQMAAMLMAVYIRSFDDEELSVWTNTMLHSGSVMDFSDIPGIKVDKHSTGGVGDKISIPLAPLLGALGFKVPMISGRGLGHTGGTLDKLESIPGFNVNLDIDKFRKAIANIAIALIGQTPEIVPLDRSLYALRDVTGTIESIPLIASSIMSKKMAEGIDGLILDVKVGRGAFMKTIDDAKSLAVNMQGIGRKLGKKVAVIFSNMNEPLGYAVGNSVEIIESVEVLQGKDVPQVTELVLTMAAILLKLFGKVYTLDEGKEVAKKKLQDGSAFDKFLELVEFQGGDISAIKDTSKLPRANHTVDIKSDTSGVVTDINALDFGKALVFMGGGRFRKEDNIDHSVGIVLNKKVGDKVNKDDTLYTVFYNDEKKFADAMDCIKDSFKIEKELLNPEPLIYDIME